MAEIALRLYLEEIDGMIDGNRAEESIVHLKHILTIYPKNLEAYRLLAKALLEKNRHLDAADVFQRVLSSVPDDFVSHVGMAVVREDEGNVDAAIWHLERAFEVQPNSGPVHEELRRLYGRRDGVEPPRLRLSRAALARMYEKGDLYAQAIAEVRAALSDDPARWKSSRSARRQIASWPVYGPIAGASRKQKATAGVSRLSIPMRPIPTLLTTEQGSCSSRPTASR
jgi:tetratricopeptide (TPR) repeat protein